MSIICSSKETSFVGGLFFFFIGLVIGSFLNSVLYRFRTKRKITFSRSVCPKCNHPLLWYDLIPLVSFLLLSGKCRYCGAKISWQYPIIEFITGLLFFLNFICFCNQSDLLFLSLFVGPVLVLIFVWDLKHKIIPDEFIIAGLVPLCIWLIWKFVSKDFLIVYKSLNGALLMSGFFLLLYLISRGRWIGFGDVKLGVLLGLYLGFSKSLLALFLSYLLGGIISIGLVALKKKSLKSEIPFAPFLILGSFISLFWGDYLFFYLF